jgi:hypothetical protein
MRRTRSLFLVVFAFLAIQLHAQCGVERWSVKTGTDSQAPSINLGTYISSTIYNMLQSAHPATLPANSRIAPRETNQYQISGTLTKYAKEGDSDYHLVIQDSAGRTMIVEIPAPNCVGAGSPFGPGISNARKQFDARFTATSTFKTTSTSVTVRGIGFWDFLHGQTGVAPNGIEVHPVLNITFGGTASFAPGVQVESVSDDNGPQREARDDVRYPADMVRDEDGGRVRVYRGGDAIGDALFHGGPVVEEPSIQVIFLGDRWESESERPVLRAVRDINSDARFEQLSRYGVGTFGMRVDSRRIASGSNDLTDLDVQRALAGAVESGSIQHLDENTIYVVVLDPQADAAIASTRDWMSYHSQFHPNDLAMRYVVVRGGLDRDKLGDAIRASLFRALVNPAGNGWF